MNEQVEVTVSNLPNTTLRKDIVEYLETAGPIKQYVFHEQGQRLSAKIVYYNIESAEMAKKFLGQRQFNARKIRISYDPKKYPSSDQGNSLISRINALKTDERKTLYAYLKKLRDEEHEMFEAFLEQNPDLVSALLS